MPVTKSIKFCPFPANISVLLVQSLTTEMSGKASCTAGIENVSTIGCTVISSTSNVTPSSNGIIEDSGSKSTFTSIKVSGD